MRTFVRPALTALLAATVLLGVEPAQASPVDATSRTGVDVSWPQCGTALPTKVPFAVVGVNGGTSATTNPCLTEQLGWAATSTAGTGHGQRSVQVYVNTGNPGDVLEEYGVTTWPTDSVDPRGEDSSTTSDDGRRNPYGGCATTPGQYRGYTNDLACSWQYGWDRAVEAVDERFGPAARAAGTSDDPTDYAWWLDVETMNSWQAGTPQALARNTATLEGMAQLYVAEGIDDVGLYSTQHQWRRIVGRTLERPSSDDPVVGGNLVGLPSWLAGSRDAAEAQQRCTTATGLSGGPVVLNQYILDDLDHDLSCV